VVSSNAPSMPEIGGEAACYFNPHDVEAMASAIRAVWTDAERRAEMGKQGLERAAEFSWKRAANETLAVYESIL